MATRNFVNRRYGLMKKANTLHRLHGARIAVLLELNDTIYSYQSDAAWPGVDLAIEPSNTFSPDHFETVADRSSPPATAYSNSLPSSISSKASKSSDGLLGSQSDSTDCSYVTAADTELQALVAQEALASYSSSSSSWSEGSSTVSATSSNPPGLLSHPPPVYQADVDSSESMPRGTKRDIASWASPTASAAGLTDYPEEPSKRPRRVPARVVRNKRGAQSARPKEYF